MKILIKTVIFFIIAITLSAFIPPRHDHYTGYHDKYHIFKESKWVDSAMASLTLDQKIGQLFMVAAWSSGNKMNLPQLENLVDQYHVGGVIFFKGTPVAQANMTNILQRRSDIPLLIGMDAEWGLAMRLDSTINFGYQMDMGAMKYDSLIYAMGKEIAYECKRLGVQVDFAPVVDVNNNPLNPIINLRSFSENKYLVAHKGYMYMKGLQDNKVLAVAKHFPGHGNVEVDSHLDLPVIKQSAQEMDTLELYPFRYLFARGVGGVMTAHLDIPAYDTTAHLGASLSHNVVTDLLRNQLHFHGLAFSDALNMKGVTKYFQPGDLELRALTAGNDILLYSENVPKAIATIKQAVLDSCLSEDIINLHVRRILAVKYWTGLHSGCNNLVDVNHLTRDLNNSNAILIQHLIAKDAITVVKNAHHLIPLHPSDTLHIASIAIGTTVPPPFQQMIKNYSRADYFTIAEEAADSAWAQLYDTIKHYNLLIISLQNLSNRKTSTYGLSENAVSFVNAANKTKATILVSFGSPYALSRFPNFSQVIEGYQDAPALQSAAAQLLFGATTTSARLPVTAGSYHFGAGVSTHTLLRMPFIVPEEIGISSYAFARVDSIVENAIRHRIFPGCQILTAYKGKVIYDKSFGYATYDSLRPVINSSIYDVASITKVAATTLAAMKLYEEKKLDIFADLGKYLPELAGTNKAKLQIRAVMAHQAGLQAWIPFYKATLDRFHKPDSLIYSSVADSIHSLQVAQNLFIDHLYKDTIYKIIDNSPLKDKGKYRYSDLGFIYMQRVIEKITSMPLNEYVDSVFYRPLGLAVTTFRPREKFPRQQIIPTEIDTVFRHQLVWGTVHDPAAAMLGGVAGHAGLFSDAADLAVIMQMMLNGGSYAGLHFFKHSTVKLFTSRQFRKNRRGLGWDKPPFNTRNGSPASQYASSLAFGHTGFTGTCVWADPKNDLIYIFLSNRVYPSAAENLLAKLNIRTDIHDIFYRVLKQ